MPLYLTLRPHERLIINGTSIRNGSRTNTLTIESKCKFLRESETILESEADTVAKRLCVTLQVIYLSEEPSEAIEMFYRQSLELMAAAPTFSTYLLPIQQDIEAKEYYKAIKKARELIQYEQMLLGRASVANEVA